MKITNEAGLPAPIVRAVEQDEYDKGDCLASITDLITPPKISYLSEIYDDQLTEEAADRIWLLLGKAVHAVLDAAGQGQVNELAEQRLYTHIAGHIISGKFDHMGVKDGVLTDYKVTSSWSVKGDEVKPEWETQLNYYRLLCYQNDIEIRKLQIVAILRDWNRSNKKRYGESYPDRNVVVVDVPMWDLEHTFKHIGAAVQGYVDAINGNPRPCTNSERWFRPGKIALMKAGRVSAVKLFDTGAEAVEYIKQSDIVLGPPGEVELPRPKGTFYLDERPGSYPRCEEYCPVSGYCDQHNANIAPF